MIPSSAFETSCGFFFVEQGSMFGDEIHKFPMHTVVAAGVASFGPFGADNVHLYGLGHVFFREQAARIDAAKRRPASCV